MSWSLGTRRGAVACLALAVTAAVAGLAPSAAAIEPPPPELHYVCVDAQQDVGYAATAADCTSKETLRTLPDDAPIHWCVDHLGRIREIAVNKSCDPKKEQSLVIPDSGAIFVCARIVQGGEILSRGALRVVTDLSDCNPHEAGFVTPAAPAGVADSYRIDEDTVLDVPAKGVLDNDRDLTGQPLTAHLVSSVSKGSLTLAADGGFRFDPRGAFDQLDADEQATTTFTYVADDGALTSDPTTVTITVTGRNDRPIAHDDTITVDEDSTLDLSAPGILGNDTDAEHQPLTADLVDGPDRGTLSLHADGSLRFDPGSEFQQLGTGEEAQTSFTYVARDGTTPSDAATVTVEVTGVNDRPVGGSDTFSTDENTPLDIDPAQLLANDRDAESTALTVTDVTFPSVGSGTLTTLPDGTLRFDPTADSADPDSEGDFDHLLSGQTATVELTYRAFDGALKSAPVTVTITVHGLSAPTANDDVTSTDEDHPVAIDLFANDELDGGSLSLQTDSTNGTVQREDGGVVRYDPSGAYDDLPAGSTGTDSFGYTLTNDEGSSTGTVTVTIDGVDDAPVAADDSYAGAPGAVLTVPAGSSPCGTGPCGVLANDRDVDTSHGDLTAVLVSPPALGRLTLDPDGGFTFDPAGDFGAAGGQTSFTYRATDGDLESATATVVLNIATNAPPQLDDAEFTILTTAAPGDLVGTISGTDPDGDGLTYTIDSADTAAFVLQPGGTIEVGPGGPPATGTYHLTVEVSDGHGGADTAAVTINVVPELNASDDTYTAVGNTELVGGDPSDAPVGPAAVHVAGLLANDGGAGGATVTEQTGPTAKGGSVTIHADGSFVYTPPPVDPQDSAAWDGKAPLTDTFSYTIAGTGVEDNQAQVTVNLLDAVWYVDSAAGSAGTGTAWDPFGSLASVSGSGADPDLPGQTIYLVGHGDGTTVGESAYPGGIALEDGQRLVGQGAALTVPDGSGGQVHLADAGPTPRVDGPAGGAAVTLARDNHLRGFSVGGAGNGIVGVGTGSLDATLPSIDTDGNPLDLGAGSSPAAVDVSIDDVSATGADATLRLIGLGGTTRLGSVELSAGPGDVLVQGNAGTVTVDGAVSVGDGQVTIADNHGVVTVAGVTGDDDASNDSRASGPLTVTDNTGQVTVGELTADGAAVGAVVTGNQNTVEIDDVELSGVVGTGLQLEDNPDGTTTIGSGTISGDSETIPGATLVDITAPDVPAGTTHHGSIHVGADLALVSADGTGDLHSGRTVNVHGAADGVTVEFSGLITGRGDGINVSDSDTVRFTGGMDIATGDLPAFSAKNIASLEVVHTTPGGAVLSSDTGTTLSLDGVGIGTDGARFDRVDSGGAISDSTHSGHGIELNRVTLGSGDPSAAPGLQVLAGTITSPATAGALVTGSSAVTLRGLTIDGSAADGIDVQDSQSIALNGITVTEPELAGITTTRSGAIDIASTMVSDTGTDGVRLLDLDGATTLQGTQVQSPRRSGLVVHDAAAGSGAQDAVTLESTVISNVPAEQDSISVTATDDPGDDAAPADLAFHVAGASPSGSLGGKVGLAADADGGATLDVDLSRLAVANTASDAIDLEAEDTDSDPDTHSHLSFALDAMNSSGGGGIQIAHGAGIRAAGHGGAVVTGRMDQVSVVSTDQSGIVLDHVKDVDLDIVGVRATGGHGVEVTHSANVTMKQVNVDMPGLHGLFASDVSGLGVDDSRFDAAPSGPRSTDTDPDTCPLLYSAAWVQDLGGADNSVTDTTLRGSTGHELTVLEGAVAGNWAIIHDRYGNIPVPHVPAPGAATTGTIQISGLTTADTGADPSTSDKCSPTVDSKTGQERNLDAVHVVAGGGADLTVDLSGKSADLDDTLALTAQDGGSLTVDGGHAISETGAADGVALLSDGDGSTLDASTDGLDVTLDPPDGADADAIAGIRVGTADGGAITSVDIVSSTIAAGPGQGVVVGGQLVNTAPPGQPPAYVLTPANNVSVEQTTVTSDADAAASDGITATYAGCFRLENNDTTGVAGTGYVFNHDLLAGDPATYSGDDAVKLWLQDNHNQDPADYTAADTDFEECSQ